MTEAKHTPGPWALGAETIVISSTVGGGCVADCGYREEGNADARLIAAAPDMLEALKLAEAAMGNMNAAAVVRAAIAKATGG